MKEHLLETKDNPSFVSGQGNLQHIGNLFQYVQYLNLGIRECAPELRCGMYLSIQLCTFYVNNIAV